MTKRAFGIALMALALAVYALPAKADPTNETLHLQCTPSACPTGTVIGGGTIYVTGSTSPTWAIWRSPDQDLPGSPDLVFVVLVPSANASQTFSINGNAATAVSGVWSSGGLTAFLGLTQVGGPANPISAFQLIPTGFDVYTVNMGSFNYAGCTNTTPCGSFGFNAGYNLPINSVIWAFAQATTAGTLQGNKAFVAGNVIDTTAPSSSIGIVPEPGTMALFGTGLIGLAGAIRRRMSK